MKRSKDVLKMFLFSTLVSIFIFSPSCFGRPAAEEPFMAGADFNSKIPSPESVTGFPVGKKAVGHNQLVSYLEILAEASDIVKLVEYGKSHEGRSLYYLIITSSDNHKKIEQIKADNARLADPRKLQNEAEAKKIIENLPAIAYLNYGIHGDELSSSDAAMYVIYHLAASRDKKTIKLLEDTVIIINPMINPDGRERFLGQIFQMTGVVENPDIQAMQHTALWSRGRGNHYLFDMNRDWLILNQPEVKNIAPVIADWNPHLLVDSHEQGPFDNYLFEPPNDPVNAYLSDSINKWRKFFSEEQAAAFNEYGWTYFTKDWYSDWGPIYANAWANLRGAVGILYEQARANSALVKQPTGHIMQYRETVHHHIVSTFANLQTLCDNRKQILTDFYEDRKYSVTPQAGDKVFIIPPAKDSVRWQKLIDLIQRQGLEVEFAQADFTAKNATDTFQQVYESKDLPEGSAVIKPSQPLRRLLLTLLEFDLRLDDKFIQKERKELENHKETLLYDASSWSLPLCFGLEAYCAESISDVKLNSVRPERETKWTASESKFGYLLDFSTDDIYPAIVRLLNEDCHPRAATKPFKINGTDYDRGTILLRGNENPDNLYDILKQINNDFDIEIIPVDTALVEDGFDLGSNRFQLLTEPRTAITSQWPVSTYSFGSIWYLIDNQLRMKCSPLNIQNIGQVDLRKYNVLILPDAGGLGQALNGSGFGQIKQWVEDGGTLIAIGSSAFALADQSREFSAVRLKKDVLDKLEEYAEAVQLEKDASDVKVDPNMVWNGRLESDVADSNNDKKSEDKKVGDIEKLKREDERNRIFSPHGAFLATVLNPEQWPAFGLGEKMPVFFSGSSCLMSKYPVQTPVRMGEAEGLRLSGLLWPEARERIADSAYLTVERLGRGQVILFADDPTYRMWFAGQQRLLKNAILLGPGLGTDQPVPW